jgi:hypothetical protein
MLALPKSESARALLRVKLFQKYISAGWVSATGSMIMTFPYELGAAGSVSYPWMGLTLTESLKLVVVLELAFL